MRRRKRKPATGHISRHAQKRQAKVLASCGKVSCARKEGGGKRRQKSKTSASSAGRGDRLGNQQKGEINRAPSGDYKTGKVRQEKKKTAAVLSLNFQLSLTTPRNRISKCQDAPRGALGLTHCIRFRMSWSQAPECSRYNFNLSAQSNQARLLCL